VSALAELQTHCLTRARDIAGEGYYEQMMITSLKDLSDTLKASLQRESGLKAETVDLEKLLDGLMKETLSGRELKRLGHEQGGS
jgi:HEPN domain-containing protein